MIAKVIALLITLDASVLVAHLSPLDVHHDAATRILLDAIDEPLLVHALTMAEVLVGGVRIGRGAEMQACPDNACPGFLK